MQCLLIFRYNFGNCLGKILAHAVFVDTSCTILRNTAHHTQNLDFFVMVIPKELLSTNKKYQPLIKRQNTH